MITKEILKKAAVEADQAIIDSLPAPVECEHEFSPSFQKKMRRTFRKAKHPIIYKLPKYVACSFLAVALGSGTWLTVDAEARSVFLAWVREQYESFVEYRFVGNTPPEHTVTEYELTWLPEGFSLQKKLDLDGSIYLTYTDDSGGRIIFSYLRGDDTTSLFVASDYAGVQSIQVGTNRADFYQASQEDAANLLVWFSEKENYSFSIMANFSQHTMIKLAEGIKKVD